MLHDVWDCAINTHVFTMANRIEGLLPAHCDFSPSLFSLKSRCSGDVFEGLSEMSLLGFAQIWLFGLQNGLRRPWEAKNKHVNHILWGIEYVDEG